MPWTNGVFVRQQDIYTGPTVWQQEEAAAIDIEADRHDSHDQDIANGISETLNRFGENAMSANLPMGGKQATNLGNGTAPSDAINKGQADEEYIQTDGGSTITNDIPMGGNTFTGLKAGEEADDAATFGQATALGMEWAWVDVDGTDAPVILAQSGGITASNVSASKTLITFGVAATSKDTQGFAAMQTGTVNRVYFPDTADSGNERTTTSVVVSQDAVAGGAASQIPFYVFRTRV